MASAKKKKAATKAAKAKAKAKPAARRPAAKKKVATRPQKASAAKKRKAAPARPKKAAKLTTKARKSLATKKTKAKPTKFAAAAKASANKPAKKPAAKLTPRAKKSAAKIAKVEKESLELRAILPASPERVLAAWLDSAEHSAFTGSDASIDARIGGKHSAWNGYIEGEILEIQDGSRVVMSWRTTEFDADHPDSIVVVEAHPHPDGTELRIVHSELPEGGAEKYGQGWREFYVAPMTKYFAG